ncbi:MAG: protein kinase family protein [Candidatus Nanopelagicales bacterium]
MGATGVTGRRIGRYELLDLVAEKGPVQLWRGTDPALGRAVGVQLIAADHPHAPEVHAAALAAAQVHDRRLVSVLDVVEGDGLLAVVSEWVTGRTLADILEERAGEPLTGQQAVTIARATARALAAARDAGVWHGRLQPNSILVTDLGEVRVRGLGVSAALRGLLPMGEQDPDRADVHGIGSVLYACLTARWPDGMTQGVAAAPRAGVRVLPPSQVVADVPTGADDFCGRSVIGMALPRGRSPFTDAGDCAATLSMMTEHASGRAARTARRPRGERRWLRYLGRFAAVVVALLAVVGLGMLGLQLVNSGQSPFGTSAVPVPSGVLTATSTVGATSSLPAPSGETTLPIVTISDFDPDGDDGTENPELVPLAVDGDPTTAWTTVIYRNPDLSGKRGTGLLIDLGAPRPVTAVDLQLVGNGTDVEALIADQVSENPEDWTRLAAAAGAGPEITLRSPRPVTGRYVLVWLTRIPLDNNRFQGGIREVSVRG